MKKNAFLIFWFILIVFVCFNFGKFKKDYFEAIPKNVDKFSEHQKELFEIHNEKRKYYELGSLEIDEKLCKYAQDHAEYMAKNNSLTHSSMSKLQEFSGASVVGENIAWGQESPESVVSSWMWSPMHRWNILGSSYKKAGFGISKDSDGRNYWCVVFSD